MSGKPVILRPKALDVLNSLHDQVRERRKLREQPKTYASLHAWERAARRRFGHEKLGWKWRCHHCGTVFSAADYLVAGAPQDKIGFACLGAFEPRVPCNYDGSKPLPVGPIKVHVGDVTTRMLAFAD